MAVELLDNNELDSLINRMTLIWAIVSGQTRRITDNILPIEPDIDHGYVKTIIGSQSETSLNLAAFPVPSCD